MAAPTNPRVESTGFDSATVYWEYSGASSIKVYRSTDGSSYSLLGTVSSSIKVYVDTTVEDGTLYYYKLSDDSGSTFSSVVTVITQSCTTQSRRRTSSATLPRAGDEVAAATFNDAMELIEATQQTDESPDNCRGCSLDGNLILDYNSCNCYDVYLTENINSIVLLGCDLRRDACLNLIAPEGTSYTVCGFPEGLGFDADNQGCITTLVGGTNGTRYSFRFTRCLADANSGFGGPAQIAPLEVNCNQTDTGAVGCQINCAANPSLNDHRVLLSASGGVPFVDGYTWSCTAGLLWLSTGGRLQCLTGVTSGLSNRAVCWAVCPDSTCVPVVPGHSTDLAAYSHWKWNAGIGAPTNCCSSLGIKSELTCDGTLQNCVLEAAYAGSDLCTTGSNDTCSTSGICSTPSSEASFVAPLGTPDVCTGCGSDPGKMEDLRTPTQKSQGCCPCFLGGNAVITTTDAAGSSVLTVITDINTP
jgi:hypothetical protein